jgi:hypothetical protein
MTKNFVFLRRPGRGKCRKVPNGAYEITITIPERIGNIYTMADRDQGKRQKQHQRGDSMLKSTLFVFQNVDTSISRYPGKRFFNKLLVVLI